MPFDPDQYLKEENTKGPGFDPDAYLKRIAKPDAVAVTETTMPRDLTPKEPISVGDSALRGGIESVTMGFGDEIGGAMEALGSLVGIRGIGSPTLKDVRLESDEEDKQSFMEVYEAMRDRRRALDKAAQTQNPKAFTAGQVVGGIATIPVGGALLKGASKVPQLAKAANLYQKAGSGSKMQQAVKSGITGGAMYGAGSSEADDLGGVVFDATKGAVVGGTGGALFNKAGDVATKGVKAMGRLISKINPNQKVVETVSELAFDLPPDYTKELLKNPKLKEVASPDQLEDLLINTTKKVRNDLSMEDSKAWNLLGDAKDIDANDLKGMINSLKQEMGLEFSEMPSDMMAKRKLDATLRTIDNIGDAVSDKDIKTLVQKLDKEIDWDKTNLNVANNALTRVRTGFDSMIKGNEAYKNQMSKVSELAEALGTLESKFNLKPTGQGYAPQDLTSKRLKNFFNAQGNPVNKETAKTLESVNPELLQEIKMRQILDRTEGGVTQGSRNTMTGGVLGGFTAGPLGAAAGVIGGNVKDKYGRKIGKTLIDKNRDKILRRDELFQALGRKIEGGGQRANQSLPAMQRGFTAATVPRFIADELGKDMSDLNETEKRSVTKIYLQKKNNPNMTEAEALEYMKKTIPGFSRKKAAEDF